MEDGPKSENYDRDKLRNQGLAWSYGREEEQERGMKQDIDVISDFLNADHRRLDAIWTECRAAIGAADIEKLRQRYPEFASGLRHHIRMEEEVLFPAFEERSGTQGAGPSAVMRMEHREIEAFLARIEALAASGSRQEVLEKGGSQQAGLSDVLRSHNLKEENILYPTSDQMFRGEEANTLLARMRGI
jgi:iron-sulfur cluster repair protein YtfE (RIC family)